jgi:hypothetical protein
MYGTASGGLSTLGHFVAQQAEQLLVISKSTNVTNNAQNTRLKSTVMLDDGSEFSFCFSIDPDDDHL